MKPIISVCKPTKLYTLSALATIWLLAGCNYANASIHNKATIKPVEITMHQFSKDNKLALCGLEIKSLSD